MNRLIKRIIIFLIRIRLGLKKYENFTFANQKTESVYWFTDTRLMKKENDVVMRSHVSLNWLLNDACAIVHVKHKI